MTELEALNWAIVAVELLVGFIWASVFFDEFFPFIELNQVKYPFNDQYNFVVRKTKKTFLKQFLKFVGNLTLVLMILLISLAVSGQSIPLVSTELEPFFDLFPHLGYYVLAGVIFLAIPKFVLDAFLTPYMIRQLKYFFLLGFVFAPLFMMDQGTVETFPETKFLFPEFAVWINLLLPTQLLAENGINLDMQEKQMLFTLLFIAVPLTISTLYQILPRLLRRYQKYGIYEWKDKAWQSIDDKVYEGDDDTAVLLLHGMGSNKEMWSQYSKEMSSERIVDHIDLNTDNRYLKTKIFGIDFSDRLKDSFTAKYRLKDSERLFGSRLETGLNNYVWELIFAIQLLLEVKEIEKIHIISHSSGGIIVRQMMKMLYATEGLEPIRDRLGYKAQTQSIETIDRISWLAVPHFGAKGGSAIILAIKDVFLLKHLFRLFYSLPLMETALNRLGTMLISFGIDAQGAYDLDPKSGYIKGLNGGGRIRLYGKHEYRNAIALQDRIIGNSARIGNAVEKTQFIDFKEKEFQTKHGFLPWEQSEEKYSEKVHRITAIHHALDVINWIMKN